MSVEGEWKSRKPPERPGQILLDWLLKSEHVFKESPLGSRKIRFVGYVM